MSATISAPRKVVDYSAVDEACGRMLTVKTTPPERIDPEIERPLTWYAQFVIPVDIGAVLRKNRALGKRTGEGFL